MNSLACTHACPLKQNVHMVNHLGSAQVLPTRMPLKNVVLSRRAPLLQKSCCIGLADICRDFLSGGKEEGDFVPYTSILFPLGLLEFYIDYNPFCHIANIKRVTSLLDHTFGWEPKA